MLAGIFRTIGVETCKVRAKALPNGTLGDPEVRPNVISRWSRVRGAASEPDYIAATFNRTRDGNTENVA